MFYEQPAVETVPNTTNENVPSTSMLELIREKEPGEKNMIKRKKNNVHL